MFVRPLVLITFLMWGVPLWAATGSGALARFEFGAGQWQGRPYNGVVSKQLVTGGRMSLGWAFTPTQQLSLALDSWEIKKLRSYGTYPAPSEVDQQFMGGSVEWFSRWRDYHVVLGYGGGRIDVDEQSSITPMPSRFAYYTPRLALGMALYQSDVASVLVSYMIQGVSPDQRWREAFGYEQAFNQVILLGLSLADRSHKI